MSGRSLSRLAQPVFIPLMCRLILALLFLILLPEFALPGTARATERATVKGIAFGACSHQDKQQPLWQHINAAGPDLFLFLGDNIYADTDDMDVMRAKYTRQDAVPAFQELRKNTRILATWDDHDFGRNDAGAEYPHKAASQQAFLDFFREPDDSERRRHQGVFGSWSFGDDGERLQVILLDTRYHRSPLQQTPKRKRPKGRNYFGPYQPNRDPAATILGPEQWMWLERELRKPAELRIIGTSIQLISNGHSWEKWGNFPGERERFFQLIRKTRANGVILLSGDRHFGEVSCMPSDEPVHGVGYPLYEFTSSGLTHARLFSPSGPNLHRIHPIHRGRNFGFINIDWPARSCTVEIRGSKGAASTTTEIQLDHLVVPE